MLHFFIFADWLVASNNGDKLQFETLPATELADLLRKFYFCVRTKKNQMYSRSAYKSIRAALQRHIESKPFFRKISIATDNEFKEANHVFTGYLAHLKLKDLIVHRISLLSYQEMLINFINMYSQMIHRVSHTACFI